MTDIFIPLNIFTKCLAFFWDRERSFFVDVGFHGIVAEREIEASLLLRHSWKEAYMIFILMGQEQYV